MIKPHWWCTKNCICIQSKARHTAQRCDPKHNLKTWTCECKLSFLRKLRRGKHKLERVRRRGAPDRMKVWKLWVERARSFCSGRGAGAAGDEGWQILRARRLQDGRGKGGRERDQNRCTLYTLTQTSLPYPPFSSCPPPPPKPMHLATLHEL